VNVLLVHDEEMLRKMMKIMLQRGGGFKAGRRERDQHAGP
jgi:hypothetical protein